MSLREIQKGSERGLCGCEEENVPQAGDYRILAAAGDGDDIAVCGGFALYWSSGNLETVLSSHHTTVAVRTDQSVTGTAIEGGTQSY